MAKRASYLIPNGISRTASAEKSMVSMEFSGFDLIHGRGERSAQVPAPGRSVYYNRS